MKVPSEDEIMIAFHQLRSTQPLSERQWITFAQWVRFDPRLGEAWVSSLSKHWQQLNPMILQAENRCSATPATIGVLIDQCEAYLIKKTERALFRSWKKLTLYQATKASGEIFFIGLHPFASQSMQDEILYATKSYLSWGFGGKDLLVNKFSEKQKKIQHNCLGKETRQKILKGLLKNQKRITVNDYILACEHRISRRVAQIDLARHPKLEAHGKSRNRFYSINNSKKPRSLPIKLTSSP